MYYVVLLNKIKSLPLADQLAKVKTGIRAESMCVSVCEWMHVKGSLLLLARGTTRRTETKRKGYRIARKAKWMKTDKETTLLP